MVIHLRVSPPKIWKDAKCLGAPPASGDYDPFFDEDDTSDALAFCNGTYDGKICPIRDACMKFALTNNEHYGIWGGCSEVTRKALRKRWPLKGKEPRPEWHWMSEKQALEGLDIVQLIVEDDDDDDDDE